MHIGRACKHQICSQLQRPASSNAFCICTSSGTRVRLARDRTCRLENGEPSGQCPPNSLHVYAFEVQVKETGASVASKPSGLPSYLGVVVPMAGNALSQLREKVACQLL